MSVSNYLALVAAMESHYRSERFGDLFASVKRAPLQLVDRTRRDRRHRPWSRRVSRSPSGSSGPTRICRSPAASSPSRSGGQPISTACTLSQGRWIDPARPRRGHRQCGFAEPACGPAGRSHRRDPQRPPAGIPGRRDSSVAGIRVRHTRSALPLPDDRNFVVIWAGDDCRQPAPSTCAGHSTIWS